jgi:hypothetical protein
MGTAIANAVKPALSVDVFILPSSQVCVLCYPVLRPHGCFLCEKQTQNSNGVKNKSPDERAFVFLTNSILT